MEEAMTPKKRHWETGAAVKPEASIVDRCDRQGKSAHELRATECLTAVSIELISGDSFPRLSTFKDIHGICGLASVIPVRLSKRQTVVNAL